MRNDTRVSRDESWVQLQRDVLNSIVKQDITYIQSIHRNGEAMSFYGVYRGRMLDNADPQNVGRANVDVEGRQAWALVITTVPKIPVGATVIVAYEHGDPSFPVILGQVR